MNEVRLNENLIKSLGSVIRMSSAEMIAKTGIPCTTWYNIMKKPAVITVQQLLAISNGLQIPVSRFFSKGKADLIDKRDDYVTEPYITCRYDDTVLYELVSRRPGASWQKAADIAGMSRTRMRNSLLAVTRTPVVRFLDACKAFDIDPFTVLVDPNPKTKRKCKAANPVSTAYDHALLAEISTLRKDVTNLTTIAADIATKYHGLEEKYEDMARKYKRLCEEHEVLLRQFSGRIEGNNIGMAADDGTIT